MAQRYKFSIESKSFPLDISGEPMYDVDFDHQFIETEKYDAKT